MAQVNVAYDDGLLRRLDMMAEKLGLSRPDLFRALAEEAVRADEQGRASFDPPEQPLSPEALMGLAHELKELGTYLDRLLRSAEKREMRLMEACNATEEANRTARDRMGKELAERFQEGATPFADMLGQLRGIMTQRHEALLAAITQPEGLKLIRSDVASLKSSVVSGLRQSRRQVTFQFARMPPFRGWMIPAFGIGGLVGLIFAQIFLSALLPFDWMATPIAMRLYGSSEVGMCELYKASHGLESCLVPKEKGRAR